MCQWVGDITLAKFLKFQLKVSLERSYMHTLA